MKRSDGSASAQQHDQTAARQIERGSRWGLSGGEVETGYSSEEGRGGSSDQGGFEAGGYGQGEEIWAW